jgi:uncharacterized protein (UPF0332 family)
MEWEDYWRKGEENLEIAGLALRSKKYNVCASRAYYVTAREAKRAYDRADRFLAAIKKALRETI